MGDLEQKLGKGSADGAGDAWKVGPAYAIEAGVIPGLEKPADCAPFKGGVARAVRIAVGEVTTLFGGILVLLFGFAEPFRGAAASLLV